MKDIQLVDSKDIKSVVNSNFKYHISIAVKESTPCEVDT